jgi:DNA polymerase-3 subunit epsilon/CBS domain-containing protein
VTALIGEGLDATLVARIVSEELRAMTRQAAILSEAAMLADGLGPPSARYALLVLGSGGRGESLLAPDQDHAFVFDGAIEQSGIDEWLAELGRRISETLDRSGIPLCKGGVMASSPKWRDSFTGWEERIVGWLMHSRPEDLLNVDIFFDMIPVHGDVDLGQSLVHRAYDMAANQPAFAKLLGDRIITANSLTLLGNIHVDGDGRIDLKAHGLFPIVGFARALALKHGLALRPTAERLGAIAQTTGRATDINALIQDHGLIMGTLLLQQARDIEAGIPPSNRIDPAQLDWSRRERLKLALRRVRHIPEMIRELMFD